MVLLVSGLLFSVALSSSLIALLLTFSVDLMFPNAYQPRSVFKDAELESLSNSIKEQGVLEPILVRLNEGRYEIIAGGFKSTGHFHCFADASKHYFGAGDDYQIYYDGTDARHYLVAGTGSYKFENGAIGVPKFNTTDRGTYIPSPYEGMLY